MKSFLKRALFLFGVSTAVGFVPKVSQPVSGMFYLLFTLWLLWSVFLSFVLNEIQFHRHKFAGFVSLSFHINSIVTCQVT